ncbi:acyl-CoA dehydrogenase family member 10 [Aphelenchoides avenae]|nr:acyl-CoA dehydrogenase family member 10 [Aphelenchus avenae]
MNGQYKAVIFDLGGVNAEFADPTVIHTIMRHINESGKDDFSKEYLRWELGLVTLDEIIDLEYIRTKLASDESDPELDGFDESLKKLAYVKNDCVITAIKALRAYGLKTAIITNNGYLRKQKALMVDDVRDMFDVVIESCREGIRKPDPPIFRLAAEKLQVQPEECIFLDDLAKNCKGAEAVGMTAIEVPHEDVGVAVTKLESLLQLKLQ